MTLRERYREETGKCCAMDRRRECFSERVFSNEYVEWLEKAVLGIAVHEQEGHKIMNHYRMSTGTPEGTDWSLDVDHEKEFTTEEFNAIAEEAIVYALEKEFEVHKIAFVSSISIEHVWEYLKSKGFAEPDKISAYYYLEPYWDKESIKSSKLKEWIGRPEINELPPYMKDHHD